MNAHSKKTFYYHAHANSLGGSLRQPLNKVVATDASASLASAGGFASRRVERFHVDGLISVEAAHVRVSGSEHVIDSREYQAERKQARNWRTITAATVEGLNILEVLTADRIVAQVSVDHPQDGNPSKITLLGSRFDNLRVHGMPVTPVMCTRILGDRRTPGVSAETAVSNSPLDFEELVQEASVQHGTRAQSHTARTQSRMKYAAPQDDLREKGNALCSLVQEVTVEAPVESFSHILRIPDFGNVFLGELLVTRFSAQLTMLRVEMGCMADGDLSACSVYSNGRPMP